MAALREVFPIGEKPSQERVEVLPSAGDLPSHGLFAYGTTLRSARGPLGAPSPCTAMAQREGDAYLTKEFPQLSVIRSAALAGPAHAADGEGSAPAAVGGTGGWKVRVRDACCMVTCCRVAASSAACVTHVVGAATFVCCVPCVVGRVPQRMLHAGRRWHGCVGRPCRCGAAARNFRIVQNFRFVRNFRSLRVSPCRCAAPLRGRVGERSRVPAFLRGGCALRSE